MTPIGILDDLARNTGGHTETILHFKLRCLNHLIDLAAYTLPEVWLVGAVSAKPARIQQVVMSRSLPIDSL